LFIEQKGRARAPLFARRGPQGRDSSFFMSLNLSGQVRPILNRAAVALEKNKNVLQHSANYEFPLPRYFYTPAQKKNHIPI